jgi:2-dehydro-3-deoxyphosphogluconate aldolase/(4S)-4-hydroxy-2-oxoglutarate aldolase
MENICSKVPVIPILVIERVEDAVPLATALIAGGLNVFEVTLRTQAALSAVKEIITAIPTAFVGVGSVLAPTQFADAARVGASFAVSPGATPELIAAAQKQPIPWLPGAQTISDILVLRECGYRLLKFFPADLAGGSAFLRSVEGPIPDVRFCPTGGITAAKAPEYLRLPNVLCVGGSWLTPREMVEQRRWSDITSLARHAFSLRPDPTS